MLWVSLREAAKPSIVCSSVLCSVRVLEALLCLRATKAKGVTCLAVRYCRLVCP